MLWLFVVIAITVGGLSENDVILVNNTGLTIARMEIDGRKYENWGTGQNAGNKVLMSITPGIHNLKLVFRGGSDVDWPRFDFKGVHEVFFERNQNHIVARIE